MQADLSKQLERTFPRTSSPTVATRISSAAQPVPASPSIEFPSPPPSILTVNHGRPADARGVDGTAVSPGDDSCLSDIDIRQPKSMLPSELAEQWPCATSQRQDNQGT